MQITFDPTNPLERSYVESLLGNLAASNEAAVHDTPQAQPVLAYKAGIADTVAVSSGLSDEDAGEGVAPPAALSGEPAKKRGRKPKAEAESAAPAVAESATKDVLPDLDKVREALQRFTAKNGIGAGVDLLKDFGAARVSELAAGEYAAFIEKCDA